MKNYISALLRKTRMPDRIQLALHFHGYPRKVTSYNYVSQCRETLILLDHRDYNFQENHSFNYTNN